MYVLVSTYQDIYFEQQQFSNLHERTKLHKGTKLYEDTFARRPFYTC